MHKFLPQMPFGPRRKREVGKKDEGVSFGVTSHLGNILDNKSK